MVPGVKTGFIEFKSPHALWRGTRFGVTFETSIESAAAIDRFVFHTEKPMKPMANLRPFVMLGSAGTMATLRALGFRGFHGHRGYDRDNYVALPPLPPPPPPARALNRRHRHHRRRRHRLRRRRVTPLSLGVLRATI